jgi:hypothetical protein
LSGDTEIPAEWCLRCLDTSVSVSSGDPECQGTPSVLDISTHHKRADDGIRTRDPHLGKVMLYQLSHVRSANQDTPTVSATFNDQSARILRHLARIPAVRPR